MRLGVLSPPGDVGSIFGMRLVFYSHLQLLFFYKVITICAMKKALDYAFDALSRRAHFSRELLEKMLKKGYARDESESAIKRCIELGYINDIEDGRRFIAARLRRGYGFRRVYQALKVKAKFTREEMDQFEPPKEIDPLERIKELLTKKYVSRDLSDYKERQKVSASLARRGFDFQDISLALSRLS